MTDEIVQEVCENHDEVECGKPEEAQAETENEIPQLTLEQVNIIRAEILKMCQTNYRKFIDSLRELPIHPAALHQCFLYFDTGALWMKEAIEYAPVIPIPPKPVSTEAPEAP